MLVLPRNSPLARSPFAAPAPAEFAGARHLPGKIFFHFRPDSLRTLCADLSDGFFLPFPFPVKISELSSAMERGVLLFRSGHFSWTVATTQHAPGWPHKPRLSN